MLASTVDYYRVDKEDIVTGDTQETAPPPALPPVAQTLPSQPLDVLFIERRGDLTLVLSNIPRVARFCRWVQSPKINDVTQKKKTVNSTHTTTQKWTNNSFCNTKRHPTFLCCLIAVTFFKHSACYLGACCVYGHLRCGGHSVPYDYRGFIKGWAPGKLTGCEHDFARLLYISKNFFLIQGAIKNSFKLQSCPFLDESQV